MNNNKGFSIIELVVSFSICIAIIIILFQIVVLLREVYEKSAIKTSLLNKQNIIVNLIYEDITDIGLKKTESCGDYCVTFTFNDDSTKQFLYNSDSKTINYGSYVSEIISGSIVSKIEISLEDNIINVTLPIEHKLFPDVNFGPNIVYYLR